MAEVEPFGKALEDLRLASLCSLFATYMSRETWKASDFMDQWSYRPPEKPIDVAEKLRSAFKSRLEGGPKRVINPVRRNAPNRATNKPGPVRSGNPAGEAVVTGVAAAPGPGPEAR